MLAHVVARLAPQVDRLAINSNGDPARLAPFGAPVLADTFPGHAGPLAGVLAGLEWAAGEGATALVTAACDTPFFPETLVADLCDAAARAGRPAAIAVTEDPERGRAPHPTFALWPVGLERELRAALDGGLRRVVDFAARVGAAEALFDAAGAPFFNVNTPADLARAEARLAERAA
jgi:molybdopterin-guanine dinucleotide biosynthesis protein A